MVRRRKIPQAGVLHHKEAAHDNTLAAAAVPDRCGPDKTEYRMRDDSIPADRVAEKLEKTIGDSYRLVAESLEILNAKASVLIKELRSGRLTKKETEARQAEINDLNRHVMHLKEVAMKAEEKLRDYKNNNARNINKS